MFCDLVGSTALSERLDPEVMREVLSAYRETCAAAIKRYDGRIARYIGDGILVYFGYPQAHEDDARRAVHAGLEFLGQLKPLSERLMPQVGTGISARLGVHTGLVVAGDLGKGRMRETHAIVGEAPNIAARLQALARPGTLVISEATRELVEGLFSVEDLGVHSLKGISHPTRIYVVQGPSDVASAFEARARRGLAPIVGRVRELSLLREAWARARERGAEVVLVSGEAGVGKSRLIRGFIDEAGERKGVMLGLCSPYRTNTAFFPLIDLFERTLRLKPDCAVTRKLDKLEAFLSRVDPELNLDAAVLAGFLSLGNDGRYASMSLAPRQLKERAFSVISRLVAAVASRTPVLLVVEDVHWIDPSTLELLEFLVERLKASQILVVMTHRREYQLQWPEGENVRKLILAGLPFESCGELMNSISGGEQLPLSVKQAILAKSDGIPLFVEELTRNVLESDLVKNGAPSELSSGILSGGIPSTLKDALMARLDRLGTAKQVAQVAAVVGRRVDPALLSAISPLPAAELAKACSLLVNAGVLHRGTVKPNDPLVFNHALLQDAAYSSLLKSSRIKIHSEVARTLEDSFPEIATAEPELLAHHCTQAGMVEKAVGYWHSAAQTALTRAANTEALVHIDKALELLRPMPETVDRHQRELMLLISRGVALTATRSYAAPEVGANYARAHELCRLIGDAPQVFPVLHGLYRFYLVRADLAVALETTKQMLAISGKAQNSTLEMEASQAHAFSLGFMGELQGAQTHCDRCLELFDPERAHGRLQAYSTDTASSVMCLASLVAWLRGFPDRAAALTDRALERAREVGHPYTSAWVLNFAAVIFSLRGEISRARQAAEACVRLAKQHDFPFWIAGGRVMSGWCRISAGERDEAALREVEEGLVDWRGTGAVVFSPYYLSGLVEGLRAVRPDASIEAALDEGIALIQTTGERWWEPELHRLRGALLQGAGPLTSTRDPEPFFSEAVRLARAKGSRSLELRAALSLGQWWSYRGRHDEARDLVAGVYDVFEEGFETTDLRAARLFIASHEGRGRA